MFSTATNATVKRVLTELKESSSSSHSLGGMRLMVVGMPNVGKSTLLNALRKVGTNNWTKAAKTGGQPGVTRAIGTEVKIYENLRNSQEQKIYMLDTPGVFVPYVPDDQAMLKLALVGCVKDGIIPSFTLADYLLYRINLVDPALYNVYCPPTNAIEELLEAVAKKTGRLLKGGIADEDAAAAWFIQQWRQGDLGHFVLDNVDKATLDRLKLDDSKQMSLSQAKKEMKKARRANSRLNNQSH
jgi:mitochondrial GTPase 1